MENPESSKGVIFDAGYRHYEGRYLGRSNAIASLALDDFKRALGFKRKIGYRIGIILLIVIQLGIAGFLLFNSQILDEIFAKSGQNAPIAYANFFNIYFETSSLFLLIFTAVIAPNLLCRDRKNGVLPLYFVRPINSYDYVMAKFLAIFAALTLFLLGPVLALFIGKVFLAPDAIQYVLDNQVSLGALLLTRLIIAFFYTSYSMAVSSLTTGIGVAAGLTIGFIFLSGSLSGIAYLINRDPGVMLIDFGDSAYRIKDLLFFGKIPPIEVPFREGGQTVTIVAPPVEAFLAVAIGVLIVSWLIIGFIYRREDRK